MAHAIFIWIVGFASGARAAVRTLSLVAPVILHRSECTGKTVPLEFSILIVLRKKGRDNKGSARSNREYKNNQIIFEFAHNLCGLVNQQALTPIDCMSAMQKMHSKVVDLLRSVSQFSAMLNNFRKNKISKSIYTF